MPTDTYDAKSSNALQKPFYRPIEVAIRWCGLIEHEPQILAAVDPTDPVPKVGQFSKWPCLQANTELIIDAIQNSEIPHGRDGKTVAIGEHVRKDRVTVRHTDLKQWMQKHIPGQKPAFLFDEIERASHSAISADSYRALKAERDALAGRLENAKAAYLTLKAEKEHAESERDVLRATRTDSSEPSLRAETTYLNIIGGLLTLMLGKAPGGKPYSVFDSQASVIAALLAHHEGKAGIAARTLEDKFAQAKRALESCAPQLR